MRNGIRPNRRRFNHLLEPLEPRTLLSASTAGTTLSRGQLVDATASMSAYDPVSTRMTDFIVEFQHMVGTDPGPDFFSFYASIYEPGAVRLHSSLERFSFQSDP